MSSIPRGGTWMSGQLEYEGFPLLLRYPDSIDYAAMSRVFQVHVTVTHALAQVQKNGLPAQPYNRELHEFDLDLTDQFADDGRIILVETFGGKRMYYFHVADSVDLASHEASIRARYPDHDLTWESHRDPDATFIRQYAHEFRFALVHPVVPVGTN